MNDTNLLSRLLNRQPGSFVGALWVRELKTLREFKGLKVTKETRTTIRAGIAYDNRSVVQNARLNGDLPAVNQGLPWGQWLQFPYLIEHKGERYVRLYPVLNRLPKVIYRINGRMVKPDEVKRICPASEFPEHKETACFTLKLANLRRLV